MRAWTEHGVDDPRHAGERGQRAEPGTSRDARPATMPRLGLALPDVLRRRRGAPPASSDARVEAAVDLAPDGGGELPRLGFVGAGRAGLGLAIAFDRAGWPVTAVASRDPGRRDRFTASVPGVVAFAEPAAVLDSADLIFLTVPDDAVAGVAASLRLYSGQALVHVSGLLASTVLAPAMAAGTEAGSFHPLVAFAEPEAAPELLRGATIAVEGDANLLPVLADLAAAVGAEAVVIEPAAKAAYHAAAVLASEGLVGLLEAIVRLGRAAGLDEAGTLAVFEPLLRQGIDDVRRLGVGAAWTGPAVRGDVGTMRTQLETLRNLAPEALDLYAAAARRAVVHARDHGEVPADRADRLLGLLAGSR